jgi:hypothetical protein
MLEVKILGPGCPRCYSLERNAQAALETIVQELPGLKVSLIQLPEPMSFLDFQIFRLPGLVVNGEVVCSGRVPKRDEILAWYQSALAQEEL